LAFLTRASTIVIARRDNDVDNPNGGGALYGAEVWRVRKAVCKLALAQAEAPGAFSIEGERLPPEQNYAETLNKYLVGLQKQRSEDKIFPAEAAEAATIVGRLAAALAIAPSAGGGAMRLAAVAFKSFAEAVGLSSGGGAQGMRGGGAWNTSLATYDAIQLKTRGFTLRWMTYGGQGKNLVPP